MKQLILSLAVVFSLCFNVHSGIHFDNTDDYIDTNYIPSTSDASAWVVFTNDNTPTAEENFWGYFNFVAPDKAFLQMAFYEPTCGNWGIPGCFCRDDSGDNATNSVCSSTTITAGTEYGVLCTFDTGGDMHIYVFSDGVLLNDDSVSMGTACSTGFEDGDIDMYVGARHIESSTDTYADGVINEFAFWNKALSAQEADQLGLSMKKRMACQIAPSDLEIYYPMDDGVDGTSADGDTISNICSQDATQGTGVDGANNTGLDWEANNSMSYPQ